MISLGKQVVEKVEIEYAQQDNGRFVYTFGRTAMCPYMMAFVDKLRSLENVDHMNRVLENFSVLQVGRLSFFVSFFFFSFLSRINVRLVVCRTCVFKFVCFILLPLLF